MKKQQILFTIVLGLLLSYFSNAQTHRDLLSRHTADSILVGKEGPDLKYREDQLYIGVTFNFLNDLPSDSRQSGFSGGFHTGFIRDIPFNKKRNIGMGVGLGLSINSFRTNLLISQTEDGNSLFQVLKKDEFDYDVNRFSTYLVEMPIQFRWRTSSAESFRFWRIYTGLQLGYAYYFHSKFKQPGKNIQVSKPDALNRLRYGVNFTFGYNTFNFTVYYSLNSIFDGNTIDGDPVGLSTFKVGLMFYIL